VAGARAPVTIALALAAVLPLANCDRVAIDDGASATAAQEAPPAAAAARTAGTAVGPPTVVDSILPIEEELRRFRAGTTEVSALGSSAAHSRDELVRRFVEAIARQDTAVLTALLVDRAEFAWLYYPHTVYSRKPYELSPGLVWFQMAQNSGKGLGRALHRFGGERLGVSGHRCDREPEQLGPNRIWAGCVVQLAGRPDELSLFGAIIERAGRFKFVSYGNAL
jgi:hypothetical protein